MNNQKREGIAFFNDRFQVGDDGWGMIAPFGDWPGIGAEKQSDGTVKRFKAIQRVDKQSATELVNAFNSIAGRIKRFIVGVPIYEGHPDALGIGHRYANKAPVGTTAELAVREDGLYARPVFTNEGAAILNSDAKIGFSVRASGEQVAVENNVPVYVWTAVHSLGLTPNPNLPVQFLNECDNIMNREKVIAWLKAQGVELANDASDEAIEGGLTKVGERIAGLITADQAAATLKTELVNAQEAAGQKETELQAARDESASIKTDFANERTERIKLLLDLGIASGLITAADRSGWESRLTSDFANELPKWQALKPAIKTESATAGRKPGVEIANEQNRRTTAQTKINELMKSGMTYDQAFARVRQLHPELFGAGSAPAAQAPGAPVP